MPVQAQTKEAVRRARHEAYRGVILEAAQRVFGAKGYGEAKVAEIAAEAGVATGTVYAIFPGKQDLYRAIHREVLGELAKRYEAIPDEAGVREALLERSRVATAFLTARPDYLRMYLREASGWGFDSGELPQGAAAFTDLTLYERGIDEGDLRPEDPRLLQSLVMASSQVFLTHWLREGMREDPDELARRIQDHARRTLFPDPS